MINSSIMSHAIMDGKDKKGIFDKNTKEIIQNLIMKLRCQKSFE